MDLYVGYEGVSIYEDKFRIISYKNSRNIVVEFEDGCRKNTYSHLIRKGEVKNCDKGKIKVGDTFPCSDGDTVYVLEVVTTTRILVKWLSTGFTAYKKSETLRAGVNMHPVTIKVGDTFKTLNCGYVEVKEYIKSSKILVVFPRTGWETYVIAQQLRTGEIKDKLLPSRQGVGVIGYATTIDAQGGTYPSYSVWGNMIDRCYRLSEINPSYRGCTVDTKWHSYGNFKKWFDENYIEGYEMDKDILQNGVVNKIYSPLTCDFVPKHINILLTHNQRSKGLPNGVCECTKSDNYRARCSHLKISEYIGAFSTPELAFSAYKDYKEMKLKQASKTLRSLGVVSERICNALDNFIVYPFSV